jgi:hypothetical protein
MPVIVERFADTVQIVFPGLPGYAATDREVRSLAAALENPHELPVRVVEVRREGSAAR